MLLTQQGWLLKQSHGIRKSWVRRYFVLDGNELRYYKTEMDSLKSVIPQHTLHLENYQVLNSIKHPHTFILAANDKASYVDFFLKAETEQELDGWIHALQTTTESVLDKWIERVDDMRPTAMQRRNNNSISSSSSFISTTTTNTTAYNKQ
ncbi:PH domain-like protein [Lichtheimia hyalospora FSU 10163]|nr:PH domain-like protein [Lichtheimia hyalospora FSU 10163]